ncbi:MAG TPA: hypothetical protein VMW80_06660 [Candidatus Dormibacteraeota bacterium]|nr:hypothetical protein [Candidatus Dormibacteraeota bacterium]
MLDPLGLRHTWYPPDERRDVLPVPGRFSLNGDDDLDTAGFPATAIASLAGRAGALVSNAAGLMTFGGAALREHRLLRAATAQAAFSINR